MRLVRVVAAIVERGDTVLIACRNGPPEWSGWWEFPGGKVEPGETDSLALQRELQEELDLVVEVGTPIVTAFRDEAQRRIAITLYRCLALGEPGRATAHSAIAWVTREALADYPLLPEDAWALHAAC